MRNFFSLTLSLLILLAFHNPASAQESGPVYIVQPGDTLSSIASRFNVSMDDLMTANGITDPNLLGAGQQLVIPGLEGLTGILDTEVVAFGDSLRQLARRNQIPVSLLQRLNHIVSPSELYIGSPLILPQQEAEGKLSASIIPAAGESLLELAVRQNSSPWEMVELNHLQGMWDVLPGDNLYSRNGMVNQGTSGLPSAFTSVEIKTLPLKQGSTAEIIIQPGGGAVLSGFLANYPLHFFEVGDGRQAALQGIHAMLQPGIYPLHLDATLPNGDVQSSEQMLLVLSGNYREVTINVNDPSTLDPAVTEPENQKILSLVTPISTQRYWQGPFRPPVDDVPDNITAWYGERRSYNNGLYNGFHSGVDYCVCSLAHPFDIYAPAPGVIVFVGNLAIRGNATIIDHGQGVYSGYWHQAETYVSAGETVAAGQLIGQIGATGRVTGPHLHWELWVNGVQVDPLDWLSQPYP
jgi:murein DD-endopeptidase MepM/ murein hydrolase activator NlpD